MEDMCYVRNGMTHDKLPPPVEASMGFICSYINSLLTIPQHITDHIVRGKMVPSNNHDECRKDKHRSTLESARTLARRMGEAACWVE